MKSKAFLLIGMLCISGYCRNGNILFEPQTLACSKVSSGAYERNMTKTDNHDTSFRDSLCVTSPVENIDLIKMRKR